MSEAAKPKWTLARSTLRDELIGPDGKVWCDWDHRGRSDSPNEEHGAVLLGILNQHDGLVALLKDIDDWFQEDCATITTIKLQRIRHRVTDSLAGEPTT